MNEHRSSLGGQARRPLAWALKWLLRRPALRHRFTFEMQQEYYREIGVTIPMENGLRCPIVSLEHWVSYGNIFAEKEYDSMLGQMPLPRRWLDLGCHAGHFTLLLMLMHARTGNGKEPSALLLDPDFRVGPAIAAMRQANGWSEERFPFLQGAVGEGAGMLPWKQGEYMTSRIVSQNAGATHQVPCIDATAISKVFPPPYDLVKLDVEGGEYHFLKHYRSILERTRHLLFEWHSWHPGGGGRAQLLAMAGAQGFEPVAEEHSSRQVPDGAGAGEAGILLLANRNVEGPDARD